ncbi:hypothetical protein FB451DRAFT_1572644 [Mycena latifolia]|nr:hypothetical protein FB451DRAFT_1572644 [Mycena latifolia]
MTQELTLPLDLEREIFETAAHRDRAMIPTLLLVCHRVHAWQPLLYRVFTLTHGAENLWSAIESAIESKPANFFHTAVRHVWVSSVSKRTSLVKNLLEHYSGITNLCMDDPLDSDLLPALSAMRLQRFAFTLPLPPPLRLDHPLFLSVTHLDIYDETSDDAKNWEDWSHLASLPALTHVCLSEEMAKAILAQLVAECRNLLIVLVIADNNTLTVTDPRVVVASLDYAEDWTKGAWGGDDMWVRAERFVAQKRRGEISTLDHDDEKLLSALESAIEAKPAKFFHTAVRHVFICGQDDPSRMPRYKNVLENCSGIINLCIDDPLGSDLLPAIIPGIRSPAVTHLDLYDGLSDSVKSWEDCSHLASLPALTHICLSEAMSTAILPQLVAQCPNILVVIIFAHHSGPETFTKTLAVTIRA